MIHCYFLALIEDIKRALLWSSLIVWSENWRFIIRVPFVSNATHQLISNCAREIYRKEFFALLDFHLSA